MAFYQFTQSQHIPAGIDEVWDFISAPANLKDITPPFMGFEIVSRPLPEHMYEGMIIAYKVKPLLGIKTTWVTEITQIRERDYFVDEQRVGPYAMWHHQHFVRPEGGGVRMDDIVSYRPPLGFLGSLANELVIRRKLREIFDFRARAIEKRFSK